MKKNFWKSALITMSLALCVAPGAEAYIDIFRAEDLNLSNNETPLTSWANSAAKASEFQSALQNNFLTIGLENFSSTSKINPQLTFTNNYSGTISGGTTRSVTSPSDGRYPISASRYLDAQTSFTITFDKAISALGFYATDIGDFTGELYIDLYQSTTSADPIQPIELLVRDTPSTISGGSVFYFGFLDTINSYQKITFRNTATNWDVFAFDDLTVAATPVPLPPTALMLGSGLLGLIGLLKLRKRAS